MKKTLIIGPTYVDIYSKVKQLPKGNEDIDILSTTQRVSGSGYENAKVFQSLGLDYDLISPVGEGVYGEAVKQQFIKDDIPLIQIDGMINGCTYTLSDQKGETSRFIMPGAEYEFDRSFTDELYSEDIDSVCLYADMLCGQMTSIQELLEVLEEIDRPLYFIPNGRSQDVLEDAMDVITSFHPTMILSDTEAYYFTGEYSGELRDTAKHLYEKTNGTVMIIKQGEGVFVYDDGDSYIAPSKNEIDSDLLISLLLCAKQCGVDTKNALMFAVGFSNGELHPEQIKDRLKQLIMVK